MVINRTPSLHASLQYKQSKGSTQLPPSSLLTILPRFFPPPPSPPSCTLIYPSYTRSTSSRISRTFPRTSITASVKLTCKVQFINIFVAGKLLQSCTLALRHEHTGQTTEEHEECEDLHDTVDPGSGIVMRSTALDHGGEEDLGDDGS